ncbi:MAG TPA: VCBS repeat-containing protein [Bryobacteraceae bacterium]|nr:VCBS repeat-containing protein [Bryobacteraceae bacterium]
MTSIRALLASAALLAAAGRPPDIPFEKHQLDLGANETCAIADINGDKRLDIVSGENWFENPGTVSGAWTKHRFRELSFSNNYVDAFSDLIVDVNQDGLPDVVTASWFSRRLAWYANPGKAGGTWKDSTIDSGHPIEFAFLVDLDNDGQAREVLPQFGSDKAPLAWYELKDGAFQKHVISPRSYGHGIGAGDVNKDGRNAVLTPAGWLEAPADPRSADWKLHEGFPKGTQLGFLHVMDVNGDGRNDVLTSHGHDYGVFWFEQGADGAWTRRMIDDSWSQAHALTLADLNGDAKPDIITGKRYMAHNGRDPGEREPLGIYWYEQMTGVDPGKAEWVRHVIDYGSRTGAGMQIPVADLDADGDLDFAVGGKSGLFVFENRSKIGPRKEVKVVR